MPDIYSKRASIICLLSRLVGAAEKRVVASTEV